MPRSYQRKTITRYSESDLLKAVEDVQLGRLIVTKSAEKYNIPLSTLVNNIKEIRVRGRPTNLSEQEEKLIVEAICAFGNCGFGYNNEMVKILVQNYASVNPKRFIGCCINFIGCCINFIGCCINFSNAKISS